LSIEEKMARTTTGRGSRWLFLLLGWTCVLLGLVGAFLPLMPTTVFLLLAAWAFARSSDRWHQWLRNHARFGEAIRAWEEHHAMPRRAKRVAFAALALSYALTATVFGPFSLAAVIGGVCIAGVAIYIAHIPVMTPRAEQVGRS
jgi:uncharacterized membrane protein YbaN (DUF454 family)